MKSKRITSIIITLMFIAGLSLVLYPTLSDFLKSIAYRRTIVDFRRSVDEIDDETYAQMLADAQDYNERLARMGTTFGALTEEQLNEYDGLLNVNGSGVMGYVVIPKLNVTLPIYHGTSDAVLQSGVGHLEGSSLPIGGESTHSVISGHRGLPSAKLFTNIDQMEVGDTFNLRILRETLTYEVDQIVTVLPHEVDELSIVKGMDYCTLLTCTPYGVNTHRLLVRGHRIETIEAEESTGGALGQMFSQIDLYSTSPLVLVALVILALAIVIALIVLIVLLIRGERRRGKHQKK